MIYHYGWISESKEFVLWKKGRPTEVARIPLADAVAMAETVAHIQTQLAAQANEPVHYSVNSQDSGKYYRVTNIGEHWTCSCPDYVYRLNECKHIRQAKSGELDPS